jgi:hypothetical protein
LLDLVNDAGSIVEDKERGMRADRMIMNGNVTRGKGCGLLHGNSFHGIEEDHEDIIRITCFRQRFTTWTLRIKSIIVTTTQQYRFQQAFPWRELLTQSFDCETAALLGSMKSK